MYLTAKLNHADHHSPKATMAWIAGYFVITLQHGVNGVWNQYIKIYIIFEDIVCFPRCRLEFAPP